MGGLLSKQQPSFDPAKDLPDLTGKVVIVTGGNSGIGFATVQHLARRGAKVYLAARSEARARDAIARLTEAGLAPGNGELAWHELDLSDPRKVKKSAEDFAAKEKRLDVLVNNAAVLAASDKMGSDGVIEGMLVNHFGPCIFTRTLLPLLKQTAQEPDSDVRVVMVSSGSIKTFYGKEVRFKDVSDLNETFGTGALATQKRYAKTKLANALYAKELQRRLDAEGVPITAVALHPGAVFTEGVVAYPALSNPLVHALAMFLLRQFFLAPAEGAHCSAFAAAAPVVKAERDAYKGAFLWPPGRLGPAPPAEDAQRAADLWDVTEALLKQWDI